MHSCQAFTHAGVLQPHARSTPWASRLQRACTQRRTRVHRRRTHARSCRGDARTHAPAHTAVCAHTHARPQEHTRTHASAHARPASTHAGVAAATNGPQGLAEWSVHAPRNACTLVSGCMLHAAHSCVPGGSQGLCDAIRIRRTAIAIALGVLALGALGSGHTSRRRVCMCAYVALVISGANWLLEQQRAAAATTRLLQRSHLSSPLARKRCCTSIRQAIQS